MLVRALQERGFTVWWDNRLEWGGNWITCIKRALDAATCAVVVWTPKSVTPDGIYRSDVVAAEATAAHRRHALLPVRIGEAERPFPHNILQEEDLSNWRGNADDAAFIRIAARLESLCGPRGLPEAGEIASWLKAEEVNNAEAFREFARTSPASRYARDAELRAAECDIRSADIVLARDAASGIIGRFAREVRKPEFTPPLGMQKVTKEISPFSRAELFESLQSGAKAVLQAAPGGGKSIALLDLARAYSESGDECIGVYLRLKDLFNQDDDVLSHLERLEISRLVSESAWHELARSGCMAVFCDGWNELSAAERDKIGSALDLFAVSYPMAGLVVGTRPLAPPPLRGEHLLIVLQSLTREQIREIVMNRVGPNVEAALAELRRSGTLLELVRNPFFLSAFCATRSAGSQATTREGLITGMLETMAAKPEHAKPLREVLGLHHDRYLTALAVEMLKAETAELNGDQARIVVNRVSLDLVGAGIETEGVKADIVLAALRDHHCLIERGRSKLSYQFQHQLLNEWYAAQEVRRLAVLALRDDGALGALDQVLNRRVWTEALLFAAESSAGEDGVDATAFMILRAMGIDPDLAGEMIAAAPDSVWTKIAPAIKKFVDEWLPISKARAIRFIMKCGKEDFADALWSAIREERDQLAAQALQDHRFDHPRVLGPNWKALTAGLEPSGRRSVLTMLASNSGIEGAQMALEGALVSREAEVQAEVADTLSFYHFDELLAEFLRGITDKAWELLVQRGQIEDLWNPPWREKAAAAAQRALQKMEAGAPRLRFALSLKDRGEHVGVDLVSELLALQFERGSDGHGLFEKVAALEPDRLSDALLVHILEGRPSPYGALRFVKRTAAVSQERLLEICRAGERPREIEALAPLLDLNGVRQLLPEFLDVETRRRAADVPARKALLAGQREALSKALYHADKNVLATAILEYEPTNGGEIGEIAELMMRAFGNQFGRDTRTPLGPELRVQIVALLEKWADRLVADPSASRHALHYLAEAMATFPDVNLLPPLRSLIQAELERWRKEKAEFKAAYQRGAILHDSGARLSYEHRYGQNMLSLASGSNADDVSNEDTTERPPPPKEQVDAVIDVMSAFLTDPEFGREAARVLAVLCPDPIWSIGKKTLGHFDVSLVAKRRVARKERGLQPTDAVAGRVLDVLPRLLADGSESAVQQAIGLAHSAARMECGDRFEQVRQCILDRGSIADVSDFLKLCLQLGHEVDAASAVKCLDGLDARRFDEKWTWEYSERWYRWDELLELMIFGGKPFEAVERLLTYDVNTKDYSLRRILGALGSCGHADALPALRCIKKLCIQQHSGAEWAGALAALGTPEAGDDLLSFLLEGLKPRGFYDGRDLAQAVARIAERTPSLRKRILQLAERGDQHALGIVHGVVRNIRAEDFVREVVALPGSTVKQLGGAIADALRDICIEDLPANAAHQPYERVPRAITALRAQLFARALVEDDASSTCARLLQVIDDWREGYGDPVDEARHPDIALGKPWPPLAQIAWNWSAHLRLQRASTCIGLPEE